ncbi:conserved protein of unknown function [Xenorhabdus poinarii G6]|uniref:Uncharacterized protein n=1 Tax=Xenorhabdus poinarii G6 TaxID=1354304 RepID=A0A068R110_9GAMM|nr:hypothetical protein [Xenorhabdus poinarii]CDG20992.1 conserved protein of unknown function [Xenorhabdus poinarii G6]
MAGQITIVPSSGNIIKGQPFSVIVSITNEKNIQNTTKINVNSPPGVTLIKEFPSSVVKGIYSQQLIFQADENGGDQTIKFTANTTGNPHTEGTYHSIDNPDLNPDTCTLRGSSAYLYDPNAVTLTGPPPNTTTNPNPFVSASINPMLKKGGPISHYDIPLRTTAPLRIFTEDMVEFLPYEIDQENSYYYYLIQKTSRSAVNLKIYATQGISNFVDLDTIFNDETYNQKQVIFITSILTNESDNLQPPNIEETFLSSTLTRPDETNDFTFIVPSYKGAKIGDFIIGFVTDDKKDILKKELFVGRLTVEESGYYKFKVAYSDLYPGDNHISYVALNQTGTSERSKLNYINYDNGGNNSPDPNDKNRTLAAPEVYNQFGLFVGIYQSINIHSIGTKGIEVWLPADPSDPNKITVGDSITIKAYISYCVDTKLPVRPLPIVVAENHIVQQSEIDNGYYKHLITADKLLGYDTAKGDFEGSISIDYSRLAQNQKSQLFTRGFDTVAP